MTTTLPTFRDALFTLENRVATFTLNRDDVRNELTGTRLSVEIEEMVDWINAHEEVSALVLTANGKAFCAGGNVKHMQERSGIFEGDVYTLQNGYRAGIQRMALAMNRLEVPAVAAVNGAAIGAGLDLTSMCDVRIASDKALFGETFINLGIIPGDGGAWFLQRLIGYQRAAELTFSGRTFGAAEALEMGFVLEVTSPEELQSRALALASSFASKPPRTVRLTKRLMKSAASKELPDFLELCAIFQGMSHHTDDHIEAVTAFLEKRAPTYKGR